MQVYLVGGAVRDKLLERPVKDKDWVVVGASEADMLGKGFQQVGKDFPVFLHPKTQQEYALARTERKVGQGYAGFECDTSTNVTLEQDLLRRDLTVNAMAMDDNGNIIDPFNGQKDLKNRVLRHVSDAFEEDPLRVLRVARFAARYASYGFTIANETKALMANITQSGELSHLSPERVWVETAKSLLEDTPQVYFETLRECGALKVWFPELDCLWGIPNPAKWHPEIDTGIHSMMVLEQSVRVSNKLSVRFAALVHDLGKGLTPPEEWPSHRGHEKRGLAPINTLCERLKVPNDCRDLALLMSEFHSHVHHAFKLKAATINDFLDKCDVWRKPERFADLLLACTADARGRTGFEERPYPNADYIWQAYLLAKEVNVQEIVQAGYKGAEIKQQLRQKRIHAIAANVA
ncbi:tRNA nucleotidyltransferase [Paraglaciecola mesophila KMM 241]|uniref:Multifunctional CCA protein n=1 Tax=Paraglaciecola mesophila KMM 241 TaxID=1128912 RepID=K6XWU3_9ALTE|nr:multifunctional CCA addition/repair protein [Paraglaciecola mesophila]GAC25094.1 tRNA nucleotidyltransferase [Paraglaciecola mesophila KMM 241]|tara:strand:- start:884 stop:2101 length:1218 start_codon:yes stop_codon:yes gene_type:complete